MGKFHLIKIVSGFILIIALFSNKIFAKGISGTYNLIGVAISNNGDTLKNQKILYYFKDEIDTITTDSYGNYSVEVRWATACPSVGNIQQTRKSTKRYNPKYLYFSYNNIKKKVRNNWRKYLSMDYKIPQKKNIKF